MSDSGRTMRDYEVCHHAGCRNRIPSGQKWCDEHKLPLPKQCAEPNCTSLVLIGSDFCPVHVQTRIVTEKMKQAQEDKEGVDTGSKYLRMIFPAAHVEGMKCVLVYPDGKQVTGFEVDVYRVLEAFKVTCPAVQHAVKKLLCSGVRGKASTLQDLQEAITALYQAVEMQMVREAVNNPVPGTRTGDVDKPLEP